jgi:hypothetical protein
MPRIWVFAQIFIDLIEYEPSIKYVGGNILDFFKIS